MSNQNENAENKARLLNLARQKVANDPFFLASALEVYCNLEKLDWAGLAAQLRLEPQQLDLVALCRRPDSTSPATFQRDIRTICERFGITPFQLASLLRRVAVYEASQAKPPATGTFLMAARDYEEEDNNE